MHLKKTLIVVIIFSVAMAVLEAATVVYLRVLFYPNAFTVTMQIRDPATPTAELAREAATIVMLVAIGYLAGKTSREKLGFFLISFAVWDIGYYVWLKVFVDWPSSILDWDILFLLPITWLGPVLAPVICSVTMICLGLTLLVAPNGRVSVFWPSTLVTIGTSLILFTFMIDYARMVSATNAWKSFPSLLQNTAFTLQASRFIPTDFNWTIFIAGELSLCCAIIMLLVCRPTITLNK